MIKAIGIGFLTFCAGEFFFAGLTYGLPWLFGFRGTPELAYFFSTVGTLLSIACGIGIGTMCYEEKRP